jgi:hypothetical protein
MALRKLFRLLLESGGADVEENAVVRLFYPNSSEPYLRASLEVCIPRPKVRFIIDGPVQGGAEIQL